MVDPLNLETLFRLSDIAFSRNVIWICALDQAIERLTSKGAIVTHLVHPSATLPSFSALQKINLGEMSQPYIDYVKKYTHKEYPDPSKLCMLLFDDIEQINNSDKGFSSYLYKKEIRIVNFIYLKD